MYMGLYIFQQLFGFGTKNKNGEIFLVDQPSIFIAYNVQISPKMNLLDDHDQVVWPRELKDGLGSPK